MIRTAVIPPLPKKELEEQIITCSDKHEVTFYHNDMPREDIGKYDILVGNPPQDWLKDAVNLKFLQLFSAGNDGFTDRTIYANPDVVLANASGAYGPSISEFMVGIHLGLIKKLHLYRDHMAQENWEWLGQTGSVIDSTVLCVGVGDIGGWYCKKIQALGAYTIGIRRTASQKPDYLDELYTIDQLPDIIGRADVVTLVLPNTKETQHIIGRDMISKMKDGAVLMNYGRGPAIDTDALCEALESGKLSGAGLDVIDPEPLPEGHPLWKAKNAWILPHVTGRSNDLITRKHFTQLACRNIRDFCDGKPLERVVDFSKQY